MANVEKIINTDPQPTKVEPEPTVTTPAAVAPSTVTDETIQKASEEYLKSLETEPAPVTDPQNKPIELPDDIKAQLNELSYYKSNPLITSFADYINGGGDVNALVIKPTKDYDSITSEDEILSEYLSQFVYDKQEDKARIPKAIEDFKKTPDIDRIPKIKGYKERLKEKNPPVGGDAWNTVFGSKLQEVKTKQQQSLEERTYVENTLKTTYDKIVEKVKSMKDFNGIPILDNQREELIPMAYSLVPTSGKGKQLKTDPDKGVENALLLKYLPEIRKNERKKGFEDGMRNIIRPSIENATNLNTQGKEKGYVSALQQESPSTAFKKANE